MEGALPLGPAAARRRRVARHHCGSWKKGDKSRVEFLAQRFVARGYVFASANYHLLPKAQFPENAEDVAAAVAWLRQQAADFGGDPKRLFLAGHSAGAHLAALVGTDARYLAKHRLKLDADLLFVGASLSAVVALPTRSMAALNQTLQGRP